MEITIYERMSDPVRAVEQLGVMMAKSGMFGCDNESAGKVLAMICMTERKSPVEIMRTYDIIGGKLRKKALAGYAEFRARGGKVRWINTGEDGQEARAEFTFEGQTIQIAFSIDQAIKGGAILKEGSNWKKTPGNMLRARCLSNAIAMLCPEIFAGGDESEADDSPAPSITMTVAGPSAPVADVKVPAPVIDIQSSPRPATPPAGNTMTAVDAFAAVVTEPVAPVASDTPAAASLPPELVAQVEAAIGAHAVAACKWLIKEGWIKPGEGLDKLTVTRANNIVKKSAAFIRAVNTPTTEVRK